VEVYIINLLFHESILIASMRIAQRLMQTVYRSEGRQRLSLLVHRVMQNRHPADELADIRADIKRLEGREQELRAYLLEHPNDRVGIEHIVTFGEQRRKHVDLRALADEIGASLLQRFTAYRSCIMIRLSERGDA
jgi:hypothetical protein